LRAERDFLAWPGWASAPTQTVSCDLGRIDLSRL